MEKRESIIVPEDLFDRFTEKTLRIVSADDDVWDTDDEDFGRYEIDDGVNNLRSKTRCVKMPVKDREYVRDEIKTNVKRSAGSVRSYKNTKSDRHVNLTEDQQINKRTIKKNETLSVIRTVCDVKVMKECAIELSKIDLCRDKWFDVMGNDVGTSKTDFNTNDNKLNDRDFDGDQIGDVDIDCRIINDRDIDSARICDFNLDAIVNLGVDSNEVTDNDRIGYVDIKKNKTSSVNRGDKSDVKTVGNKIYDVIQKISEAENRINKKYNIDGTKNTHTDPNRGVDSKKIKNSRRTHNSSSSKSKIGDDDAKMTNDQNVDSKKTKNSRKTLNSSSGKSKVDDDDTKITNDHNVDSKKTNVGSKKNKEPVKTLDDLLIDDTYDDLYKEKYDEYLQQKISDDYEKYQLYCDFTSTVDAAVVDEEKLYDLIKTRNKTKFTEKKFEIDIKINRIYNSIKRAETKLHDILNTTNNDLNFKNYIGNKMDKIMPGILDRLNNENPDAKTTSNTDETNSKSLKYVPGIFKKHDVKKTMDSNSKKCSKKFEIVTTRETIKDHNTMINTIVKETVKKDKTIKNNVTEIVKNGDEQKIKNQEIGDDKNEKISDGYVGYDNKLNGDKSEGYDKKLGDDKNLHSDNDTNVDYDKNIGYAQNDIKGYVYTNIFDTDMNPMEALYKLDETIYDPLNRDHRIGNKTIDTKKLNRLADGNDTKWKKYDRLKTNDNHKTTVSDNLQIGNITDEYQLPIENTTSPMYVLEEEIGNDFYESVIKLNNFIQLENETPVGVRVSAANETKNTIPTLIPISDIKGKLTKRDDKTNFKIEDKKKDDVKVMKIEEKNNLEINKSEEKDDIEVIKNKDESSSEITKLDNKLKVTNDENKLKTDENEVMKSDEKMRVMRVDEKNNLDVTKRKGKNKSKTKKRKLNVTKDEIERGNKMTIVEVENESGADGIVDENKKKLNSVVINDEVNGDGMKTKRKEQKVEVMKNKLNAIIGNIGNLLEEFEVNENDSEVVENDLIDTIQTEIEMLKDKIEKKFKIDVLKDEIEVIKDKIGEKIKTDMINKMEVKENNEIKNKARDENEVDKTEVTSEKKNKSVVTGDEVEVMKKMEGFMKRIIDIENKMTDFGNKMAGIGNKMVVATNQIEVENKMVGTEDKIVEGGNKTVGDENKMAGREDRAVTTENKTVSPEKKIEIISNDSVKINKNFFIISGKSGKPVTLKTKNPVYLNKDNFLPIADKINNPVVNDSLKQSNVKIIKNTAVGPDFVTNLIDSYTQTDTINFQDISVQTESFNDLITNVDCDDVPNLMDLVQYILATPKYSSDLDEQRKSDLLNMSKNITEASKSKNITMIKNNHMKMEMKKQFVTDLQNCINYDFTGNMAIHNAVLDNDLQMLARQIFVLGIRSITINVQNSNGFIPIQLAIINNSDIEIITKLLENGADTNVIDDNGNNLLHLILMHSTSSILNEVLSKCKNFEIIDTTNDDGLTPLMLGAIEKKNDLVEILLDAGANPNIRDEKSGRTALFHAVENDADFIINLLLRYKADPKLNNFLGVSPIDAARDLTCGKILLQAEEFHEKNVATGTKRQRRQRNAQNKKSKMTFVTSLQKIDPKLLAERRNNSQNQSPKKK